jgi:nitrile hydratase
VLAEFGTSLPAETEVRVWDSTAEIRYLVLPMQPEAAKGLSEAALGDWVSRDSMIGVGIARQPAEA